MGIIDAVLKRYFNLSLLELSLFFLFGLGTYYVFQLPRFLPFLNFPSQQKDIASFPANVFLFLFWFLLFLITKRIVGSIFRFLSSFWKYDFKANDWSKKWEHQGNIRLWEQEDALYVTDSNSGCILKNHYWKNLEMSFKCKFPLGTDDQTLGIIFRAKSLSDYLMIQINNKLGKIVPHIRTEGRWETSRTSTYDINMTFEQNVFFDVKLKTLNEKVELFINGDKRLDWNIPTNSDLVSGDPNKRYSDTIVPKIDFRKSYGRIGFRAYQGESAIVKNLSVQRTAGIL